jgi:hypothetical protein
VKRVLASAFALALAGCAAGAAPAETPSVAPAEKQAPDEDHDGAEAPASGGDAYQYAQPPGSAKEEQVHTETLSLGGALDLFEKLDTQLASGVVDCGNACKALGSMQRAMDRICELTGPDDPEKRCQSAREKAKAARERVEKHCPDCT